MVALIDYSARLVPRTHRFDPEPIAHLAVGDCVTASWKRERTNLLSTTGLRDVGFRMFVASSTGPPRANDEH